MLFCVQVISFCRCLRFIHVITCANLSFIFMAKYKLRLGSDSLWEQILWGNIIYLILKNKYVFGWRRYFSGQGPCQGTEINLWYCMLPPDAPQYDPSGPHYLCTQVLNDLFCVVRLSILGLPDSSWKLLIHHPLNKSSWGLLL